MTLDFNVKPDISAGVMQQLEQKTAQLGKVMEDRTHTINTDFLAGFGSMLWAVSGLTYDEVIQALVKARKHNLSIRIFIVAEEQHIQNLPWELLFHENKELGFLFKNPLFTIIRTPGIQADAGTVDSPLRLPAPIRILSIVSSPEGAGRRLDYEKELEVCFQALDERIQKGEAQIHVMEDGCIETLEKRMNKHTNNYHVIHISCHGCEKEGEPALLFEEEKTWQPKPVTGKELAEIFVRAGKRVPCLFISACNSADDPGSGNVTGVAQTLLNYGIPNVIAMKYPVSDRKATELARAFYHHLAEKKDTAQALSLARAEIAQDDAFSQWIVPVHYAQDRDTAIIDWEKESEHLLETDTQQEKAGEIVLLRHGFLGRRRVVRELFRGFASAATPHLFFTGTGGVGKTATAGHFAILLEHENPGLVKLGFKAPFSFERLYEELRGDLLRLDEFAFLEAIKNDTIEKQAAEMLSRLAGKRPVCIILDNIEDIQNTESGEITDPVSLSLIRIALGERKVFALLTGRYPVPALKETDLVTYEIPDAGKGDILHKMGRMLWPADVDAEKKEKICNTLGGNFRAIEWINALLNADPKKWRTLEKGFNAIEIETGTPTGPVEFVRAAMKQNLLFTHLVALLPESAHKLLARLSVYQGPVTMDGIRLQASSGDDAYSVEDDLSALQRFRLVQESLDPGLGLPFYQVPAIIRGFIKPEELTGAEWKHAHLQAGYYYKHQAENCSNLLADAISAMHHFRKAEEDKLADEMAEKVTGSLFALSFFSQAMELLQPILARDKESVPWWAWINAGRCSHVLGKPDDALFYYTYALFLVENNPDPADKEKYGTTLNNISQIYDAKGKYDKALGYLEQSLAIYKEIGDRAGEGTTLSNICVIYHAKGEYDKALAFLEQSFAIYKEIGDRAGEGTTLNNICAIYHAKGEYDKALGYLEQSLAIRKEIGDRAGEGTTLNNISQIYHAKGEYDKALTFLEQSLAIYKEIGNRVGEGATLNNICGIYHAKGEYDKALGYLEQSLAIRKEIKDRAGEGTTLNNISQIYDAKGEYDKALAYLEQSLTIRKEIGDRAGEGTTLNNICAIYHAKGEYDKALRYLEQSLTIYKEIGDRAGEGITLNNISQIYSVKGEYDKALTFLDQSLAIQKEIGDRAGEGATLNNICGIYHAKGEYNKALGFLEQSLTIRKEIGDRAGEFSTLHNMSHIYRVKSDIEKALNTFAEALQIAVEIKYPYGIFNTAWSLGNLLCQIGNKDQGLPYLTKALEIGTQLGLPDTEEIKALIAKYQ